MGVLNVTPDSFSDGGRFAAPDAAVRHARQMIADGADLIDVGGESTRPGSAPVPPEEQIRRVMPVLQEIGRLPVAISIDTSSGVVAEAAIDAGACIVNDVFAGTADPGLLPMAGRRGACVILMQMQGTPATMQLAPAYADVVAEVADFLRRRRDAAIAAGVPRHKILLDPGIGFGKAIAHNLQLIRELPALAALGRPLVLGVSRKKFIGDITGETAADQRVFGTAAAVALCAANGAAVLRVHDVGAMARVVRMVRAIQGGPA